MGDGDLGLKILIASVWIAAIWLVLAYIVNSLLEKNKRQIELNRWACKKGWTFDPSRQKGYGKKYPEFYRLNAGHTRRVKNVITGQCGKRNVVAFDFTYKEGYGKHEVSYAFSAVIVSPEFPLKSLLIRPERFGDKVAAFFGDDDINFESEEFSRRFFVRSPDRKWAYDVIHTRMMEFLMSLPGDHIIQFSGSDIFITRGQGKWSVAQFEDAINVVNQMLELLPNYLLKEMESA